MNESEACTKDNADVSSSFLYCYLNQIEVTFLCSSSSLTLLLSGFDDNPNEAYNIEPAQPLQVPSHCKCP